jgi:hypothetical protein
MWIAPSLGMISSKRAVAAIALTGVFACTTRPVSDQGPTSATFSGTAALSTTAIDFGTAPCGGASPADKTITITNTGTLPLNYTATVDDPAFTLGNQPTSGTIETGASATLSVHAVSVPSNANAGAATTGNLVLTTSDPSQTTIQVPLKVTPAGAQLTLSAPATFSQVEVESPTQSVPLVLTNTGTAPVAVAIGQPTNPAFAVSYAGAPQTVVLAPGASLPGLSAQVLPSRITLVNGVAPLATDGVVCGGATSAQTIPLSVPISCR